MKSWTWFPALTLTSVLIACSTAADELPRRGTLGLKLTSSQGGIAVDAVLNPSLRTIHEGDKLLAVNGAAVSSIGGVAGALGRPKPGDPVTVSVLHEGQAREIRSTLIAVPEPALDGHPLELGHVTLASGDRIRTLLARPTSAALVREGKAPAMMMVPGIPCQTNEVFGNTSHPDTRLYSSLTAAGFAVYVVDKPGVGDSEGTPCPVGGFDVEVEAYRAAARALAETKGIDASRLFAIGISIGGIQAPLIAQSTDFKGIVTWGTVVMPWYDYLLASFRRRAILQGEDPVKSEAMLRDWRKVLAAAFVDGLTRDQIAQKMPDVLTRFEASAGNLDKLGGRSLTFAVECDKANVFAAWRSYRGALLSLHGSYDWVAEDYDHALAAHIINATRPGAATFEIMPGLDHGQTRHDSLAESFAHFAAGAPDDQFEKRVVAWMVEQAKE